MRWSFCSIIILTVTKSAAFFTKQKAKLRFELKDVLKMMCRSTDLFRVFACFISVFYTVVSVTAR